MARPTWPPDPPLVAVIRVDDAGVVTEEHLHALARHGLAVEVAMTCTGATALLRRAVSLLSPLVPVGAGTVLSAADADAAEAAGAQFASSPAVWPGLEARPVPAVPGVLTPAEVAGARARGFTRLKFFPARLGPAFLRDLRAVFPDVDFWPSGGVSDANAGEWREVGAAGVFLGQSLLGAPADLADPATLDARAERVAAAWSAAHRRSR
jgi:2-dehydro-3-deoxyphosphogluconate aldolase/(4S)-4-hydroxy-2-oxoglutarate aldolase